MQRAIAIIDQVRPNESDNTKIDVEIIIAISGSDIGEYSSGRVVLNLTSLDPTALTLKTTVAAAIKAELIANGVGFGIANIDTVSMY